MLYVLKWSNQHPVWPGRLLHILTTRHFQDDPDNKLYINKHTGNRWSILVNTRHMHHFLQKHRLSIDMQQYFISINNTEKRWSSKVRLLVDKWQFELPSDALFSSFHWGCSRLMLKLMLTPVCKHLLTVLVGSLWGKQRLWITELFINMSVIEHKSKL